MALLPGRLFFVLRAESPRAGRAPRFSRTKARGAAPVLPALFSARPRAGAQISMLSALWRAWALLAQTAEWPASCLDASLPLQDFTTEPSGTGAADLHLDGRYRTSPTPRPFENLSMHRRQAMGSTPTCWHCSEAKRLFWPP